MTYYADLLGFLGTPGQPPVLDPDIRLNLVHVTSVPPWLTMMDEIAIAHIGFRNQLETNFSDRIRVVQTYGDFDDSSIAELERTRIVFGLQRPPANPDFNRMHKLGIRITGIAYDEENTFGSGFKNPKIGLKPAGEEFIEGCLRHRIILDLSHASRCTARDVLRIRNERKMNLAVMASHGGCYHVYDHNRNLPDDFLKEIAYVGVCVGS